MKRFVVVCGLIAVAGWAIGTGIKSMAEGLASYANPSATLAALEKVAGH